MATKRKFEYRYEITAVEGDTDLKAGNIIRERRYMGRTHEWLIYNLSDMTLRATFHGKLIERVPA